MICPVCHIMYDCKNNENMFDHIRKCKGRKDIITTRWYTKEYLLNKEKPKRPSITIDVEFRPVTR